MVASAARAMRALCHHTVAVVKESQAQPSRGPTPKALAMPWISMVKTSRTTANGTAAMQMRPIPAHRIERERASARSSVRRSLSWTFPRCSEASSRAVRASSCLAAPRSAMRSSRADMRVSTARASLSSRSLMARSVSLSVLILTLPRLRTTSARASELVII